MAPKSSKSTAEVVTVNKSNKKNQKWFIEKHGTILNADHDLVLDIPKESYKVGQKIIVFEKHSRDNQIFEFASSMPCIAAPFEMFLFTLEV